MFFLKKMVYVFMYCRCVNSDCVNVCVCARVYVCMACVRLRRDACVLVMLVVSSGHD